MNAAVGTVVRDRWLGLGLARAPAVPGRGLSGRWLASIPRSSPPPSRAVPTKHVPTGVATKRPKVATDLNRTPAGAAASPLTCPCPQLGRFLCITCPRSAVGRCLGLPSTSAAGHHLAPVASSSEPSAVEAASCVTVLTARPEVVPPRSAWLVYSGHHPARSRPSPASPLALLAPLSVTQVMPSRGRPLRTTTGPARR